MKHVFGEKENSLKMKLKGKRFYIIITVVALALATFALIRAPQKAEGLEFSIYKGSSPKLLLRGGK